MKTFIFLGICSLLLAHATQGHVLRKRENSEEKDNDTSQHQTLREEQSETNTAEWRPEIQETQSATQTVEPGADPRPVEVHNSAESSSESEVHNSAESSSESEVQVPDSVAASTESDNVSQLQEHPGPVPDPQPQTQSETAEEFEQQSKEHQRLTVVSEQPELPEPEADSRPQTLPANTVETNIVPETPPEAQELSEYAETIKIIIQTLLEAPEPAVDPLPSTESAETSLQQHERGGSTAGASPEVEQTIQELPEPVSYAHSGAQTSESAPEESNGYVPEQLQRPELALGSQGQWPASDTDLQTQVETLPLEQEVTQVIAVEDARPPPTYQLEESQAQLEDPADGGVQLVSQQPQPATQQSLLLQFPQTPIATRFWPWPAWRTNPVWPPIATRLRPSPWSWRANLVRQSLLPRPQQRFYTFRNFRG